MLSFIPAKTAFTSVQNYKIVIIILIISIKTKK